MAELTIRPEEIRDALDRFVSNFSPETASRDEVGTVVTSGDGIARVEGLPSAMANELLEFANGTQGIALNLDVREIGVVVLGESEGIEEGGTQVGGVFTGAGPGRVVDEVCNYPPVVQHEEPVGQVEGFVHVVGHEQDGGVV